MSLTTRLRGTGQHRSADEIRRLRDENRRHLTWRMAADDAIAILHCERREAIEKADEMRIRAIEAETVAKCALAENERLQAELTAVRAQLANATAVSVPAGHRDIDPDDRPTVPVPLWQAPIAGPVITTSGSSSPAHVPSWAKPAV